MKRGIVLILSVIFLSSLSFGLNAQEKKEKITKPQADSLIQKYTEEEATLKPQYEKAKAEVGDLQNTVSSLDEQVKTLQDEIAELKKKVEARSFYVVKPGDWLSKLAEYKNVYGKGHYARWKNIYRANKGKIKDWDLIYPGWKLVIPRP